MGDTAMNDRKKGEILDSDSGHATDEEDYVVPLEQEDDKPVERVIVWENIVKFIILHGFALYGLTLLPSLSLASWIFLFASYQFSGAGITAGAHRLWAHKTYKAKYPLRVFLMVANSMAGENSIYTWSRDHRLHHKSSETHGDPHNANRGFFFSHMGWLLVGKHPAVMKAGKTINMTDLEQDSLVMFQHRHYLKCFLLACFVFPTLLPHLLWGENLVTAYFVAVFRYVAVLHFTWLVNSAAHMFGMKPYDKNIRPAENRLVSVLAMGEGYHNYHHTLAYDLKTASPATVAARAQRTGNPSLTKRGIMSKD